MNNLGCTEEVSPTGGVIPQARALESLFVLLVPLLAGFLVLLDQIKVSHTNLLKVEQVDCLCEVLVEVWILFWALVVAQCHDGRAIFQLLDILILFRQVSDSTAVISHLQTINKAVCVWVVWKLCRHVQSLICFFTHRTSPWPAHCVCGLHRTFGHALCALDHASRREQAQHSFSHWAILSRGYTVSVHQILDVF